MPAGISWPRYIAFFVSAMASGLLGAQVVHNYYRPLDDVEELVNSELQKKEQSAVI